MDVPVVSFGTAMDQWLGVLPQWKRLKKFMFTQFEEYIDLHPELLWNASIPTVPPPYKSRYPNTDNKGTY